GIVVTAGSHGSSGSPSGWPYSTGFSVYTRPYLVNGTIYVGNTSGHVYALNASTGAFRWRYPRGSAIGAVYSRPGVADHMVYVGSDNGLIYAIRARDGAAVWSSRCDENGDAVRSSPVFVDGVIYASTRGGSVCALKADDGSRFWDRPVLLGTTVPASSPEVSRHLPGSPPSQRSPATAQWSMPAVTTVTSTHWMRTPAGSTGNTRPPPRASTARSALSPRSRPSPRRSTSPADSAFTRSRAAAASPPSPGRPIRSSWPAAPASRAPWPPRATCTWAAGSTWSAWTPATAACAGTRRSPRTAGS